MPVFNIGAAFGRVVGELMHMWYPAGQKIYFKTATINQRF